MMVPDYWQRYLACAFQVLAKKKKENNCLGPLSGLTPAYLSGLLFGHSLSCSNHIKLTAVAKPSCLSVCWHRLCPLLGRISAKLVLPTSASVSCESLLRRIFPQSFSGLLFPLSFPPSLLLFSTSLSTFFSGSGTALSTNGMAVIRRAKVLSSQELIVQLCVLNMHL